MAPLLVDRHFEFHVGHTITVRKNHAPGEDLEAHLKTERLFEIKIRRPTGLCGRLVFETAASSAPSPILFLNDPGADCHCPHLTPGNVKEGETAPFHREKTTGEPG